MLSPIFKGSFDKKRKTETAGTEILQVIEPSMKGAKSRITSVIYTCGSTAHTLSLMKALAKTTTTAAKVATDTTLPVTSASFLNQTIAANDFIVVKHTDGTYGAYKVSGISSLTLTINALSADVAAGSPVWVMGAIGEAEHRQILVIASVMNQFRDPTGGLCTTGYRSVYSGTVYKRSGNDDPILVHSGNATAAGVLEAVSGYYGSP
jgi:hypothetical protein